MKPALIRVADIYPNPDNVRDGLGDLTELTGSIRRHGLLQPLIVKPRPGGGWDLVDGTCARTSTAIRRSGRRTEGLTRQPRIC